jgi:phosphoheptose isomerase
MSSPVADVQTTDRITALFAASSELLGRAAETQTRSIATAAQCIVSCLLDGGKILSCGNGSSAADAQYFAAHMQHRFQRERPGLPAVALTADAATLTAIGVDDGFDAIYARQLNAIGQPGDVLLTLSINGNAGNLIAAMETARERQLRLVALTGRDGGAVARRLGEGDTEIRAPSDEPARILENHRLVLHCLFDIIDLQLMGDHLQ